MMTKRTKLMRPIRLWRLYQARKRVPSWGVAGLMREGSLSGSGDECSLAAAPERKEPAGARGAAVAFCRVAMAACREENVSLAEEGRGVWASIISTRLGGDGSLPCCGG